MANKNLDKDLLERFRALDLEKTFTIASSYKSTAVEYLTKNPQYTQVTAIYSKIEDAIEHI
ncbi:hypothetical protein KAZ93_04595 [Patescibacteria group bacterium]|nr:hypothetical protein [Patescibacteria group bacterium]